MKKCTLINGDCFQELKKIPDNSIDLVLTDPPYGIKYKSNHNSREKYKKEVANTTQWDYFNPYKTPIREFYRVAKQNSFIFVFSHWKTIYKIKKPNNVLIWFKNDYGMGNLNSFSPSHEIILLYEKGNPKTIGKRPQDVLIFNKVQNFKSKENINLTKMVHPTQKPVNLLSFLIEKTTKKGDVVLDPFMGSGSTGVAALKLQRKFIGIEINKKYFEIAKNRIKAWEQQERLL